MAGPAGFEPTTLPQGPKALPGGLHQVKSFTKPSSGFPVLYLAELRARGIPTVKMVKLHRYIFWFPRGKVKFKYYA